VPHGATEKNHQQPDTLEPKYQLPLVVFAGPPVRENAMKANLLDNVLAFTCIAAFITDITIAAVTLFG